MSTKITWTQETWNPLTGCWGPYGSAENPTVCRYCYARGMARRLHGQHKPKYRNGFEPTFHPEELERPTRWRKPRRVFVCSMADLFGPWVPDDQIEQVLSVAAQHPQHTFQFLTKHPRRLAAFRWPQNCWVGTSVNNQATLDERLPELQQVGARVRFLSVEPMHESVELPETVRPVDWLLIGQETGPARKRYAVEPWWVEQLTAQAHRLGVPVLHSQNLGPLQQVQQYPRTY